MTGNVVKSCTFWTLSINGPYKYRLARGIHLLADRSAFSRWRFLSGIPPGRDMARFYAIIFLDNMLPHAAAEVNRESKGPDPYNAHTDASLNATSLAVPESNVLARTPIVPSR